jgi:hypothetical protein
MQLDFLDRFSKNTRIPDLIKIRPVGDELFHADERRERTKLIFTFRNLRRDLKMECDLMNSLLVSCCKHDIGPLVAHWMGNCLTHGFQGTQDSAVRNWPLPSSRQDGVSSL